MAAQLILTKVRSRRPLRLWMARCDQLLSRARLAEHEDRRVGRRHDLDLLERVVERAALADDFLERVLGADLAHEVESLLGELVLELGDLAERERVGDRHRDLAGPRAPVECNSGGVRH